MVGTGAMRPAEIYDLSSGSQNPAGQPLGLFNSLHLELITLSLLLNREIGGILKTRIITNSTKKNLVMVLLYPSG